MSGPTYRITTEFLPGDSGMFPWQARVAQLSDGAYVTTRIGETEEEALRAAVAWVAMTNGNQLEGGVYECDDDGNLSPLRPSPTWGDGAA